MSNLLDRRRVAFAIRVRQELRKSVERRLPMRQWRSSGDLFDVVRSDSVLLKGADRLSLSAELADRLRAITVRRLPIAESLQAHKTRQPADAASLIAQANAILAGQWKIFGCTLTVPGGRPRWRAHPLSGIETPLLHFTCLKSADLYIGGDVKYLWEINRHGELLRLAQAYYLTGNELYAEHVISLLDEWMESNPPSYGVNWFSVLEVALRSIGWCWIWQLTAKSPSWTVPKLSRFLWTLAHAASFIRRFDSVHHSPNTHLTGEALGLLYIATLFDELRGARHWRDFAIQVLQQETNHQFLSDGFHFERATGYHRYNVEFYLHAYWLATVSGEHWGDGFREPLTRALNITAAMRREDGSLPVLGDEDGGAALRLWAGSPQDSSQLLALGSAILGRSEWIDGLNPDQCTLPWWMNLSLPTATNGAVAASLSLPSAGYFISRDLGSRVGWHCVVDAGPHGGERTGHAHTDLGHVEIALGRQPIISDPGCAVYGADSERRDWYRSLNAHATLCVDGNSLARPRGTFGWASIAPTPKFEVADTEWGWCCRLWYDLPNAISVTHERQVFMIHGWGISIVDWVAGRGPHELRWRWPLAFALAADALDPKSATLAAGPAKLYWGGSISVTASLVPSYLSPSYGKEHVVSALECAATMKSSPAGVATVFTRSNFASVTINASHGELSIDLSGGQFNRRTLIIARPRSMPLVRETYSSAVCKSDA